MGECTTDIIDLVNKHDKIIDSLATAVEHLATTTESTNVKLDKVVEALTTQNVLIERMNNMESNLKEAFARVYRRLEHVEGTHNGAGCTALKLNSQKDEELAERIDNIEDIIKWATRLIFGTVILSILGLVLISK